MKDNYRREINYLRVSVTDRCNLRCIYCMPPQGVESIAHDEVLRLEEITRLVKAATLVGVKKIRLTGGEPLVRKGIDELINSIASIPEIDDLAMTTNGILLGDYIKELKEAGLKRINISLDTLKPEKFKYITRGGCLEKVWTGIEAALAYKIHPVKLNTVVIGGFNDDEILDLTRLSLEYPLHIRFIELMPVGACKSWSSSCFIPQERVKTIIEENLGKLFEVRKLTGSGPAHYYRLEKAPGTIGFIAAISDHFCDKCNRLRLTSTGGLRPCLYADKEIDVKEPLRMGATLEELSQLIVKSIKSKPGRHHMSDISAGGEKNMSQIGG